MAKKGRPTKYTKALADRILDYLSSGMSLRETCRQKDVAVDPATVMDWVELDREGFSPRYARAIEKQLMVWGDQIIEISDDGSNDWMERKSKDGSIEIVLDNEHVQRSKLRIDARKWVLSKLMPKRYGEVTKVTGSGPGGSFEFTMMKYDNEI